MSVPCVNKEIHQKGVDNFFSSLNLPPNLVRPLKTKIPWEWVGAFKNDPTWHQVFDGIEKERNANIIGE